MHGLKDWRWQAAFFALNCIPIMLIWDRVAMEAFFVAVGLLWVWESYGRRDWSWLRSPPIAVGIALWAWILLVATPLALQPAQSVWVALPFGRFILFFAAVTFWVLARPGAWKSFLLMQSALIIFVMLDTWAQYATGVSLTGRTSPIAMRLTGPFDNVKVGIYLVKLAFPILAIAAYGLAVAKRWKWACGALLAMVAMLFTVLISGERTAFVQGALATVVLLLLLGYSQRRWRLPLLGIALALIGAAITMMIFNPVINERVESTFTILSNVKDSPYGWLWQVAWQEALQQGVHGTGLRGFRLLCLPYAERGDILQCNLHPHNIWLEWWVEAGAVGLILFIGFVTALVWKAVRLLRMKEGIECVIPAVMLAVLVMHFFPLMPTQSFFSNWPAILFWFSLSVTFASRALLPSRMA